MNERLKALSEIDRIQDEHCKPCVFLDENGKAIYGVTHSMCHERECPHIVTLLKLGEQFSGVTQNKRKQRAVRKQKKISRQSEGESLAKEPKWKLAGLTVDLYRKLQSEGKTDREIREKFKIDNNELYKFKNTHNLVKKRTDWKGAQVSVPEKPILREKDTEPIVKLKPEVAAAVKAQQTAQGVVQVPTNEKVEQVVVESAKPDTTQTDVEKQLIDANLTIVNYKSKITQVAKDLEVKDAHIEELEEEIIKLESKLGTPSITHDDYELLKQRIAELENQIERAKSDLVSAYNTINDYEQKLEANTVKLAEVAARNQALQEENEQLRIERNKGESVQELLKEKISLQLENTKLKQELDELLVECEPEKQHPAIDFENPYVDMHDELLVKTEVQQERIDELEELVERLLGENSELKEDIQQIKDLNYFNLQQFVQVYTENEVNKRAIRNLEKKGATA